MPSFQLFRNHFLSAKILFCASHIVLSLAFFIASKMMCFCERLLVTKYLDNEIGSLLSCLLCVDITPVHIFELGAIVMLE